MDRTETKILVNSLKLIVIGIFFWILKIKYITLFFFPKSYVLNQIGFEIIGTILILTGLFIIHRVYPFAYSSFAILLCWFIAFINIIEILNYFIIKSYYIYILNKYLPFLMSLLLFLIARLLKSAVKYFGDLNLSKKWDAISLVILFGFSIPYYAFTSLEIYGFLSLEKARFGKAFFLLFTPLFIIILYLFFYYIYTLANTFKFLNHITKNKKI